MWAAAAGRCVTHMSTVTPVDGPAVVVGSTPRAGRADRRHTRQPSAERRSSPGRRGSRFRARRPPCSSARLRRRSRPPLIRRPAANYPRPACLSPLASSLDIHCYILSRWRVWRYGGEPRQGTTRALGTNGHQQPNNSYTYNSERTGGEYTNQK